MYRFYIVFVGGWADEYFVPKPGNRFLSFVRASGREARVPVQINSGHLGEFAGCTFSSDPCACSAHSGGSRKVLVFASVLRLCNL